MCGIVGYSGGQDACGRLMHALSCLEYRGYDSAGVALWEDGEIQVLKEQGRLDRLRALAEEHPHPGGCGIGHTRWATHGSPTAVNAHPHRVGRTVLVHNGIIENYAALRERLAARGMTFASQTDTEIAAGLIESLYDGNPLNTLRKAQKELEGSFAFAILFADRPGEIYGLRRGSPLIAAADDTGGYLASDLPALLDYTNRYYLLEEGEMVRVAGRELSFFDRGGFPVRKQELTAAWSVEAARKDGYDYFMLKEIDEEPAALRDTVLARIRDGLPSLEGELPRGFFRDVRKVNFTACGTALYAGMVGKALMERLARLPAEAEAASEQRYRDPVLGPDEAAVILSQSGETADSLAALRMYKARGVPVVAIVNVVGSSIAREADYCLYTHAGPEIAVASTKAYSAQIGLLYLLAILAAREKGTDEAQCRRWTAGLVGAMGQLPRALELAQELRGWAGGLGDAEHLFYLGRGLDYPLALEGSLKLKEISYIHSEALAAGELKHGAIALITEGTPVIALATQADILPKMVSGIREVKARGARVLVITLEGLAVEADAWDHLVTLPAAESLFAPLLLAPALQLLAAGAAVARGCDVDKPRNLAKSVTVE